MDVAIGLPNAVPGTTGEQLTEWARRAESRGFSSRGTIDRIAYPNYEPLTALAYFSLGDGAEENARAYLEDYYAWLGPETAGYIANSAAKDAETVKQYVSAFEGAGCDELIMFPSSSDPDQVDLLADALGR